MGSVVLSGGALFNDVVDEQELKRSTSVLRASVNPRNADRSPLPLSSRLCQSSRWHDQRHRSPANPQEFPDLVQRQENGVVEAT
jgi:hypothetical protein